MSINTVTAAPRAARLILPVIAALLLAAAVEGPDFGHYADWAGAALHGDIFDIRSEVLSPSGMPFTVAAPGTGLLFAIGRGVLFTLPFAAAALAAGWVAAVTFWLSAIIVFHRLARGDWNLVLFGAGLLFVGTHAGLYSHAYATEVFANALIALLWALALTRDRRRLIECGALGALAGLLLIVRAHVVLYAAPALWVVITSRPRTPASGKHIGDPEVVPASARLRGIAVRACVTGIPIAIAAAQYGIVNRWMTGSPLRPPYVYGGTGFSSVNLWDPELLAVLVHPLHGLLSYHPAYGVAFVALAFEAWRSRSMRLWWWATFLAVLAHVWVQAGWYVWWLGGATFGMRGMAPAALPLVAAFIATVRRTADAAPSRVRLWLGMAMLACAWSGPLLLRGNSQFLTWRELLAAQRPALLVMTLTAVALAYATIRAPSAPVRPVTDIARPFGFVLLAAAAAYLAWRLSIQPAVALRIAVALIAGSVLGVCARAVFASTDARRAGRARQVLAVAVLAVFAVEASLFARLAIRAEAHIRTGAAPPRPFAYVGAWPVDELRVTYAEYRAIPGFEDRKTAFRRFLAWQRVVATPMSPADRRIAEAFRLAADREPLFGDLLVEATARGGVVHVHAAGLSEAQQSRVRAIAHAIPGTVDVDLHDD